MSLTPIKQGLTMSEMKWEHQMEALSDPQSPV